MGRGVFSPSDYRDLGARHKLPSPAENGFYAYFRLESSHLEHPFSTVERWRGPQTSRGPGKLPPLDGLGTGVGLLVMGNRVPLPPARRSGEQCKLSDTLSKLPWSGVWGGAPENLDF